MPASTWLTLMCAASHVCEENLVDGMTMFMVVLSDGSFLTRWGLVRSG